MEANVKELYIQSMTGDAIAYERFLTMVSIMARKYISYLDKGQSSKEILDELEQEVLMSVHLKKNTYQPDRPILPWIYAISRHRYIDYCRAKKRQLKTQPFLETSFGEDAPIFNFEDLFDFLTPKEREILVLVKIEGANYEMAASHLNMNVNALKVRVHRIVKGIRKKYEENE